MSFLNPILLLGLAGISVPIIIHLLNNRQVEKVTWAAMRFLRIGVEKHRRRLRIEDLLLLLARCLLIGLIALALARPAIRAAGAAGWLGSTKVTAVVVLDHSASMSATDGVKTRLAEAKDAGVAVIESLPSGSQAAVLLTSDVADPLLASPSVDLDLAARLVRTAPRSDRPTDLLSGVRAGLDMLRSAKTPAKELYVITDGTAEGFRRTDEIAAMLVGTDPKVRATFLLVGEAPDRNLSVNALRLAGGLPIVGRNLRFEAQVTNHGETDAQGVRVRLSADGEPPSDEQTIDRIAPGQSRGVSLYARVADAGDHVVEAAVDADRMPADDSRALAINVSQQVKILLVDGDPNRTGPDGPTLFLDQALVPVPPSRRATNDVTVQRIPAAGIGSVRPDEFDAIVLADVATLSAGAMDSLAAAVAAGRGLIAFIGPNAAMSLDPLYTRDLPDAGLLAATVGVAREFIPPSDTATSPLSEVGWSITAKGLEHPIAQAMHAESASSLASVRVQRVVPLTPLPAEPKQRRGPSRPLLLLEDGSMLAAHRSVGRGRVVLVGTGGDRNSSNLPLRPGTFVPFVQRLLASATVPDEIGLNLRVGGTPTLHVPDEWVGLDATITPPSGDQPPETVRVNLKDGAAVLVGQATLVAGAFRVEAVGDTTPPRRFAVQMDASESNLRPISAEQEASLASAGRVLRWTDAANLAAVSRESRQGTELWKPLVVAALLLGLAETLMSQWFSRPK